MKEGKIRILHVAQAAGGVDRYIQLLLKYMNRNKYENIIVCSQDFCKKDYEGLVVAFEQVEMNREIGIKDIKAIISVRHLIKKYKPDVVYAHSSKAGAVARIANIGLKNYCIYNPHGWAFNMKCSRIKKEIYTLIEKMAAPFCEKIICISESEKESALKSNICAKEKLQVILNGIDIDSYTENQNSPVSREKLNIPREAFVVGMVGRISTQKAPDIFIRTAKLVKKEIPDSHFIIVGSGNMERQIRAYAKENLLEECLHITGWVSNPLDYMRLFDVACLFSRWEGFGLVLPEYMLLKKPVVATNCDAIPSIVQHCQNGLLVDVDDVKAASRAIIRVYKDDKLRRKMVDKGYKDVCCRFDARRVAKETEELLQVLTLKSKNN